LKFDVVRIGAAEIHWFLLVELGVPVCVAIAVLEYEEHENQKPMTTMTQ